MVKANSWPKNTYDINTADTLLFTYGINQLNKCLIKVIGIPSVFCVKLYLIRYFDLLLIHAISDFSGGRFLHAG